MFWNAALLRIIVRIGNEPLGARWHEMYGERAAQPVCVIGGRVVQRLAMVKHNAAGGQVDYDILVLRNDIAHIKQGIGR
mgnify:CR=1 FL=1